MRKRLSAVKPNRRQILLTGAVAVAGTTGAIVAASHSDAADSGPYGSGVIANWLVLSKAISPETIIKTVIAKDGVFMFGDSIAVQDGKSLAIRLAGRTGDSLAVHNWSGRPTTQAVDALQDWATKYGMPRRILMATGTNDVFNPPVVTAQINRTMSIVGPNRTVVWVNTQMCRTARTAAMQIADQRNSAWINLQLADAQRRYPNLRIVHWAEYLAAKPTRLTAYLSDGVHTTVPYGQDARNELITQALAAAKLALPQAKSSK
ncbi:hypothetical protein [Kribbella sp. VKM Ac-2568]|uniref:hypothetical protein n=1 Tax=Kribbella sp. VKM Ac-2568 TaxID=2512219 RepID=UPI001F5432E1|nr:hypothetical protein [Kribbella sp. VKM Ac-2568]